MDLKILHVAETVKGGVATVMRQLLRNGHGYDFHVIVPEDQIAELKCPVSVSTNTFVRTGRNIKSFLNLGISFIKTVREVKPDIIHLHSTFAGVIGRVLIKFIPGTKDTKIIYCPHAFAFMMDCSETKKRIYSLIERSLQNITDKIICVSNYERDEAIKWGMRSSLLHVIYNSVEAPILNQVNKSPYVFPDKINILFVGRFDFQKGFDMVEKLALRLDDNFHITVIGGGVHSSNAVVQHPLITYVGWLDSSQIAPYMALGDVMFMPSRWESFGLVAVEAQSYGMPVIATDCTSLPEVIDVGKTGFLFKKESLNEAVELIVKHDKEYWSSLNTNCVDFYYKKFTSEKMCLETYKLYS